MGRGQVLVLNAGSSSLRFRVVDPGDASVLTAGRLERLDETGHERALSEVHRRLSEAGLAPGDVRAVGHRVVHGGDRYTEPVLVDDDVLAAVDDLARLVPLHNPPAAAAIRLAADLFPAAAQVAVFDTGWFADLPPAAATYALDAGLAARTGIRRYGMHGISHEYVAGAAASFLDRDPRELALVVLHLGSGASAAAVSAGRPVDVSMGMTPLEGLVMGTRAGDLDPGVLLHLLTEERMSAPELVDLLHHRAGLQGLAGVHDFRDLLAAVDRGDPAADLAYDVYCHRLRKYVGAYLAVLGGADAVVFTGGVGEHCPRVRADALAPLGALGISVDAGLNRRPLEGPRRIGSTGSPTEVLVVPTDEEGAIARKVVRLLES